MKQQTKSKSQEGTIVKAKEQKAKGEYTAGERARITRFTERCKRRAPRFTAIKRGGKGDQGVNVLKCYVDGKENVEHLIKNMETFGTVDENLANRLLMQAIQTYPDRNDLDVGMHNYTMALLHGIGPRDELEGMLAIQMVGVHNLAMQAMQRASDAKTYKPLTESSKIANTLLRTFVAQIEALNRYRGKGQQKVMVEHVHVNKGGQAIVGNVSRDQGGV